MKEYSVVPNKDATGWYVKMEDVAAIELYDTKSQAISEAEELAKGKVPCKVTIYDEDLHVEDERRFN
ncbi:DUF2188 domain-containing protein [Bacillus lacus]|uniref:DUF2188 domain-containing protein n=1 Tax=Metabacillus lacus TaxID=1983721 RepID=A0A7X2J2J1_9BACI|nr:DUF2188 domain-containing protein [Metabacillus lacus]MRX73917.1 DUF2188 domain-containing protein [Metabacillus lacus]